MKFPLSLGLLALTTGAFAIAAPAETSMPAVIAGGAVVDHRGGICKDVCDLYYKKCITEVLHPIFHHINLLTRFGKGEVLR
jgi:hypothetical protein